MATEQKTWNGNDGEQLSDAELREVSKTWTAGTWEEFLKTTVEHPLRETLSDSTAIENLEDAYKGIYQEMLQHADYPHLKHLVGTLMKRLTIREREVVYEIFWHGLSQQEVGNKLRIKKSAVRNYRDRALKKMGVLLVEKLLPTNGFDLRRVGGDPQTPAAKVLSRKVAS